MLKPTPNHLDISRTVPDTGLDLVFHATSYRTRLNLFHPDASAERHESKFFSTRESAERYLQRVRNEIAPESAWEMFTVPGVPKSTFVRVFLVGVEHITQLRPVWASEI